MRAFCSGPTHTNPFPMAIRSPICLTVNMLVFVSLALLFALFSGTPPWASPWAAETGIIEREEIEIGYDKGLEGGAEEVLRLYPQIRSDLEKRLKRQVTFVPGVLLLKEESFSRAAGNPYMVAFAIPERNLIVIDYSKMSVHPFTIELTLKHELCHILLHRAAQGGKIPKWLDEGLAQWVSAGIAEILINPKRSLLTEAVIAGKSLDLRALVDAFPRDRESLHLAYEVSKSFVAYFIERFGIDSITEVLEHIEKGEDWEIAVRKAVLLSFDAIEEDWHHDLKRKLTWYTYVINNLYEILFFFAAILAVIGFLRAFLRKRAYMRQDDAERSSDAEPSSDGE
jgi:Peptidase MA superfamily